MGRLHSMNGLDEKFIQHFGRKSGRKDSTLKIELICFRIGTSGGGL